MRDELRPTRTLDLEEDAMQPAACKGSIGTSDQFQRETILQRLVRKGKKLLFPTGQDGLLRYLVRLQPAAGLTGRHVGLALRGTGGEL